MPFLVAACAGGKNIKYKDTHRLEMPPEMKMMVPPKALIKDAEEIKNTGLGSHVLLAGQEKQTIIKIKKTFDRSWDIVEQALKLNEIEITDKNREQGVFYVLFDPDKRNPENTSLISNLAFFIFEDEYAEAAYKLTVVWRDNNTEVSIGLVDQPVDDHLDEYDDEFEDYVDDGGQLLNVLFKTIKDDLPLN